ncbi:hypothetical protein IAT38_001122 [Cryptococcus sp. DSM 104549]
MILGGSVDLSSIPLAFLEVYPFPALVIQIDTSLRSRPRLVSRDTDATVRQWEDDVSPLAGPSKLPFGATPVAWGNARWNALTQGRTIGECLDGRVRNKLQAWVEGDSRPAAAGAGDGASGESFVLDMKYPAGVTLYLAKTVMPATPASDTHALCILTSQRIDRPDTPIAPVPVRASPGLSRSTYHMDHSRHTSLSSGVDSRQSIDNPSPLSTPPLVTPESIPRHLSTSTIASTRSNLSSVDAEPFTSPLDSPSTPAPGNASGTSGGDSYFPRTLQARDDRLRSRVRRRSPHGPPDTKPEPVSSQAGACWRMVEAFDWASTPLGPREQWRDALDPVLAITFESRTSDCAWLGPDLRLVYNKAYQELVDHPRAFGQPGREVWASNMDYLTPFVEQCLAGIPVYKDNDAIFWRRYGNGRLLEHYHTWRYVPITGKDGHVCGIFNQSMETTDQVLLERRMGTQREMSEQMLLARTTKEYFDGIADVLEQNPSDAPFALCYKVQQTGPIDGNTLPAEATLQSTVGVPEGHSSAQDRIELSLQVKQREAFGANADRMSSPTLSAISMLSSGSGRKCHVVDNEPSWPIAKALNTRQCVIVEDCTALIDGYTVRQWDELPFSAIVVPICGDGALELPEAVLILGLNVRRPFDTEYDNWIYGIRSLLVSTLASVKAYEAEQTMAEDAARLEKAKAAWFRGAAHDLRSPLSLVAGPLADMLETALTASQRASVTLAQRNLDRLMRLVNALMDFSRVEAGRMEGKFVPLDLGAFVTELAALFRPAVERLGLEYIIEIEPRDDLAHIDPVLFETVVANMIGNALKYTEQGSIRVRVRYTEQDAEVSVVDTGVGIPSDELALVTEWFHRASTALHSGSQGSGLGLALAKELLRLHEGELLVESKTANESGGSHGSTFTARLPLSFRPQPAPQTEGSPEQTKFGKYGKEVANEVMRWVKSEETSSNEGGDKGSGSGSGSGGEGGASSGKSIDEFLFEKSDVILIVEDNLDMREYLKRIFSPYCIVREAANGEQGLEMAIASPPNLILSDMLMPKLSGLDFIQEIRNHPTTRIVPMVLLSAAAEDESRVEALLNGAEDYLAKPFKPKELLARVHLHLQVGKKRANLEALYSQRETELAVLSDLCPMGIFRGDSSGHLSYLNDAYRAQSGIGDGDADSWPELVDPTMRERILGLWSGWLSNDDQELRAKWRWTNGTLVTATLVRLDRIKPGMSGVIGCVVDVTPEETRLLEAEDRRKEAEESKHQQELLIDLTSHEIRTPVSAILQCSSLVKENLVALKEQLRGSRGAGFQPSPELLMDLEQDVEALESIYQCGLVQERIAGDVLSLARIQLDMLSLHDIEVSLRKEARKVFQIFASEAKMKKIDLVLEFGATVEQAKVMSIKTDPVRLGQVVTNLISNAIRFTSSSETKKITIKYDVSFVPPAEGSCAVPSDIGAPSSLPAEEDTPLWLFVSVTDSGPGMNAKELGVLFQRFAQGNKMIHTKYGGSGLGLFICRKITELLGGRIEVLSQLGEGSVFRFFIKTSTVAAPSALAALMEASSLGSISGITAQTLSPTSSQEMSRSSSMSTGTVSSGETNSVDHILIVEDNIINQTVLKRQLVKAGLTCDVANNGLEALNLIREAHRQARRDRPNRKRLYDVVVMDLEMPVMDGLTAIEEIRQSEAAGTLGRNMVIALTGNARQGQIDQAMAAGMDDVVIKPYVLGDLLAKIRTMKVRKRELEAAAAVEDE